MSNEDKTIAILTKEIIDLVRENARLEGIIEELRAEVARLSQLARY